MKKSIKQLDCKNTLTMKGQLEPIKNTGIMITPGDFFRFLIVNYKDLSNQESWSKSKEARQQRLKLQREILQPNNEVHALSQLGIYPFAKEPMTSINEVFSSCVASVDNGIFFYRVNSQNEKFIGAGDVATEASADGQQLRFEFKTRKSDLSMKYLEDISSKYYGDQVKYPFRPHKVMVIYLSDMEIAPDVKKFAKDNNIILKPYADIERNSEFYISEYDRLHRERNGGGPRNFIKVGQLAMNDWQKLKLYEPKIKEMSLLKQIITVYKQINCFYKFFNKVLLTIYRLTDFIEEINSILYQIYHFF